MGVYIRDMKMPSNCQNCLMAYRGGCSLVIDEDGSRPVPRGERPDWCPMTYLPPHGRLVDLDSLMDGLRDKMHEAYEDGWGRGRYLSGYCEIIEEMMEEIEDAPVIIERGGETKCLTLSERWL